MWASLAISLLVIGGVTVEHFWKWDREKPGPQSLWFYRFAILTLLLGTAVGAYGYFLFRAGERRNSLRQGLDEVSR